MQFKRLFFAVSIGLTLISSNLVVADVSAAPSSPSSAADSLSPSIPLRETKLNETSFDFIRDIVDIEIKANHIPGAVVLIGQQDRILYRKAFGLRSLVPKAPMTTDTIFDLASMSKVVVTTTAIMQLVEQQKIQLDEPAATYWPEFATNNKNNITIRQLLTHTSGLPAGIEPKKGFSAHQVFEQIAAVKPVGPAGQQVLYSDINFVALGKMVSQVTGLSLNDYAEQFIFEPLHLANTGYNPYRNTHFSRDKRKRIAPTIVPLGEVQDPLAHALDGAAGNAGVFSTADDLAIFAQTLLKGGAPLLKQKTLDDMFMPQLPTSYSRRGLGWRTDPVLASNRAALPFAGAVSHFGYTGTGMWIDPVRNLFVIILSNRLIVPGEGDAGPLRAKIMDALCEKIGPLSANEIAQRKPQLAPWLSPYENKNSGQSVMSGIDVLAEKSFEPIQHKRIALLTNRSAVNRDGKRTIDVLFTAPNVSLVKLFSPEHGLNADQEGKIKDDTDPLTGLPIVSLYGDKRKPTAEMLKNLDAVVVDLQDVGARFYTYASSIAYLLEAAAPLHLPIIVLDRPNPVDGISVQGPVLDEKLRSFTGYWSIPVRHGMTMAELAELFVGEAPIAAQLEVIPMKHYARTMHFNDTGLPFVPPSPNLSARAGLTLYPGIGMIEAGAISVGRGTLTPFEVIGAPWIDATQLSKALNQLHLEGVRFEPTEFTPIADPYAGKLCKGVRMIISDTQHLNTPQLGLSIAALLWKFYPEKFALKSTLGSIGSRRVIEQLQAGTTLDDITKNIEDDVLAFKKIREKYLLY